MLIPEIERREERNACAKSFAEFVRRAWRYVEPNDKLDWNWHLDVKCVHLQALSAGKITNLIINEPPGYAKSLVVSVLWVAWEWGPGGRPDLRWMASSYSSDISIRDSIRCRSLIESDWYQRLWGDTVRLIKRNEARLDNSAGGIRIASSVGGLSTGERVHRAIHDDLLRANDEHSRAMREQAIQHLRAMSTRAVNPDDYRQVLIMQRLHEEDPTGWLLKNQPGRWDRLRLRASYQGPDVPTSIGWVDPRRVMGEPLWKSRYPTEVNDRLASELQEWRAAGQLQQEPSPAGGGILKKKWWREWPEGRELPECDHVFCSWDTAYSEEDLRENSASVMTEWGIWWNEHLADGRGGHCVMLLSAWHGWVEYPDLKARAMLIQKDRQPDRHLIEKKASGQSLIQDLRRSRVPVYRYNPDRDKVSRAYAVQSLFAGGSVWYPGGKTWATTVIDACASFPMGVPPSSDYCFVAGTMIATRRGPVPIENVTAADLVLTPDGWKRVIASGCTGLRLVISRVGLIGTPNHPIFTVDTGYTDMDTVTQASELLRDSLCGFLKIALLKSSNSMEFDIGGWAAVANTISRNASQGEKVKGFMWQSGNAITVNRFRHSMMSIISTVTHSISSLRTWSVYRAACIAASLKITLRTVTEGVSRLLRKLAPWLLHGIALKLAVSGIEGMSLSVSTPILPRRIFERRGHKSKAFDFVSGAVGASSTKVPGGSSVRQDASYRKAHGVEERTSSSTRTLQPVYNLTIDGPRCYFANGILVHNCDTVTQALLYLRNGWWLDHPDDEEDEEIPDPKVRRLYG